MSQKKQQNGLVEEVETTAHDPSAEPANPAQEAEETAQALDTLVQELQQTKEQLLRQAAEFQNYRRRTERERTALLNRGRAEVIEPLLNVLDDLHRSLDATEQAEEQDQSGSAYQALKQGVELVYQNFSDVLQKLGVERIEAVGQPFDEYLHEAMMQQPAPEGTTPGTVLQELQTGYRLGDRILRHAKVIVAA